MSKQKFTCFKCNESKIISKKPVQPRGYYEDYCSECYKKFQSEIDREETKIFKLSNTKK